MENKLVIKTSIKKIEEVAVKGKQSIEYRLIASMTKGTKTFKIRIDIKRDSYDFQSSAVGKIWGENSLEWKPVYSIPYQNMKTPDYLTKPTADIFKEDKNHILLMMEQILYNL